MVAGILPMEQILSHATGIGIGCGTQLALAWSTGCFVGVSIVEVLLLFFCAAAAAAAVFVVLNMAQFGWGVHFQGQPFTESHTICGAGVCTGSASCIAVSNNQR